MKTEAKLIIVLILLVSAVGVKAQSTASAVATVTIITPVTVSSNQGEGFETVKSPTVYDLLFRNGNIYLAKPFIKIPAYNSTVTAADFTISAGSGDVYALTVPQKIVLLNVSGTAGMNANLLTGNGSSEAAVHYGKQHLTINAGLRIENGQAPGKYASQAFDVTVNFN